MNLWYWGTLFSTGVYALIGLSYVIILVRDGIATWGPDFRSRKAPKTYARRRLSWTGIVTAATLFLTALTAISGVYFGGRIDRGEAAEASLRVKELELRIKELERAQKPERGSRPASQ